MLKNFSVLWKTTVCSFVFLLLCIVVNTAHAINALPGGGSDFGSAIQIVSGKYQGQLAPGSDFYYSIKINKGQEIDLRGGFTVSGNENMYSSGDLYIYDQSQQELFNVYGLGGTMGPWLSASNDTLYIRMVNEETETILTYNLEITFQNRFDAATQTDAGDTFEGSLPIAVGSYSGYLAGVSVMQTPYGNDFKDYYKVALQKGKTYEFKLTPSSGDEGILEMYNANRELIDEKTSPNGGSIITLSLVPSSNTNIFLVVGCGYKGGIFSYKLDIISSSTALTKFYNCKNNSCAFAGDFASLDECQRTTASTCYATSNCDGKCTITGFDTCLTTADCMMESACINGQCVPIGVPPAPDVVPDVPVTKCESECTSGQTKCFDNFNYYKCGDYNKDGCFEWASPVYCGEGNKCDKGKCTKEKAGECHCSEWQSIGCGASECGEEKLASIRVCTPAACDIEKTCQDDSSCKIVVLPPTSDDGDFTFPGFTFPTLGVFWIFYGLYAFMGILLYIYSAICLQAIAKKTDTKNGWMAWIPIANLFLMVQIAQKPLWWIILFLVPIVNIVIVIIIWMEIAGRRGREKWVGALIIAPVIGIGIPAYLAFSDSNNSKKNESSKIYTPSGDKNADKPTVGYKHPCKYCGKLIPPNSIACPFCEKTNPLGPDRCPKCHEPIDRQWKVCAKCNQNLRIVCPFCGKITFFGDHCEDCSARLLVTCPNCGQEQPPIGEDCIKCGGSLKLNKHK